jgi:hypothetical protein
MRYILPEILLRLEAGEIAVRGREGRPSILIGVGAVEISSIILEQLPYDTVTAALPTISFRMNAILSS